VEVDVRRFFPSTRVVVFLVSLGSCILGWAQAGSDPNRFDGPAELPRQYVKSALSETPAPGKSVLVKNAAELGAAIEKAACGDTIRLQAGNEFAGNFKFPAKACDDAHWIVLRTSAADGDLPPEGTRITPCYAGVASMPGRPRYPCTSTSNVMAKVVFDNKGSGPLTFLDGANHYRFLGLEITRGSPGATIYNLAFFPENGVGNHLVFDRVWMHGTPQDETTRGIALGGSRYVAVVDSYFSDFHCVAATGACVDSQTIAGGVGPHEMGPYKVVNNFLEAAGENLMFGGGPAVSTPADIEIRRNHMFKPTTWRQGAEGFVGGTSGKPFIVKNLFELKNGQRVLFEGNVLENSWGGFSQAGFAILLTAKNQNNKCPACKVSDITVRYDRIAHCASGFQIATGLSDAGGASSGTERISIHDVIVDDIGGVVYGGFGAFAQVTSSQPALRDLTFNHVTGFPPKTLFILGGHVDRDPMTNFTFTNNLVGAGQADIFPPGGGPKNCSFQPVKQTPSGVLKSCFNGYNFSHNAIVGSKGGWPSGNSYPADHAAAGLADFSEGRYRLCRDKSRDCKKPSPALQAGADGKDLGADEEAVFAATKGVE
jgi:hypothetical protein